MVEKAEGIQGESSIARLQKTINNTSLKKHRKSEGLRLQWPHINTQQRLLTVEWPTKSGKIRYVPLTRYALNWLAKLDRVVGVSRVFLKPDRTPWKDPKETFTKGKKTAGLEWVGLHDLRHFRATQWVMNGVDLRTFKSSRSAGKTAWFGRS